MQNFKTLRQTLDHLEEAQLLEKLKASDPTGEWVSDFVDSDDPKFAGKSKKERIQMALGASYAAKRAEGKIKEEAEEFDEELTPMQNTHFELMNKHRVAAQFTNGPERDMHLTAAAKHERALRNHSSQDHSSSMTSSKKLGVTEEAEELDEVSADVAKRVAQARDRSAVANKLTSTQSRRLKMGDKGGDPDMNAGNALKSAMKRGAKNVYGEEVELDEAINHLQMAKHHQALAKEHDRISDAANRRDEPELSDAHGHQSDDHQDAAKAHLQAHKTGNPKDVAAAKKATRRSLQTGSTPGGSIYHVGKYGNVSHEDYNYSKLRSGADAIKKGLKEEVEELDELSKSTLASYAKKATQDARMSQKAAKDFERHELKSKKPEYKAGAKEWKDKYQERAFRRQAGANKAIDRLAKEEVELDEGITKDTGWKPAPKERKDQYGNPIKTQNVPKRLAKQGMPKQPMKEDSEDRPGIHKVSVTINDKDKDDRDIKTEKMLKVKANNPPAALKIAKSHYGNKGYKVHTASYHGIHEEGKLSSGAKDPCWKGYEMVGTKKKNGREVPNCVPKK